MFTAETAEVTASLRLRSRAGRGALIATIIGSGMVHGFRLVTVYSVVLLVLAAAVVTVSVSNPAHKAG